MISNIDIVRNQFLQDQFAHQMGIVLDDLTPSTIRMHMQLTTSMNNLFGRPHGGAIFGLADAAFGVLGNNGNNLSVAIDCSISYHNSPNPGEILWAEGELISESRKIGSYLFRLFTKDSKTSEKIMIATMKSTLYRTGKPIKEEEKN
jgi:acyl-CoA thioesterase